MTDDAEKDDPTPAMLPVSPSTGIDPEFRQFAVRVMHGYEAAHRTIADMAEVMAKSAREAQEAASKAIRMQIEIATEREALISKNHQRQLEAEAAKQRQEAMGQLTSDLRSVLTLAGKKYLGIPLTGNDSHGLQDFLKTLTGDQIEALMTEGTLTLTVAQRHLLAATMTSLAEAEAPKLSAGDTGGGNSLPAFDPNANPGDVQ